MRRFAKVRRDGTDESLFFSVLRAVSFQHLLEWELKDDILEPTAESQWRFIPALLEWELKGGFHARRPRETGGFIPAFAGVRVESQHRTWPPSPTRCVSFQHLLEWELKVDISASQLGESGQFHSSICWSGS